MLAVIKWYRFLFLPILLVQLILIGIVTPSSAQPFDTAPPTLPPKIMADRHLVKAEQLEARKDYAGALKVMDKVFAMQKEYDLKLPDEILYKYARVAMSADSVRIALASVHTYLVAVGKEGAFYKEALALSLEAEEELQVPEILAEDMCTGKQRGAACWLELANRPGCYVWDVNYYTGYSVTWSASCIGRVARGEGTLVWTSDSDNYSESGRLRRGKYHGHWVERSRFGLVSQGAYVEGAKHGPWVIQRYSNMKERGKYTHGKREGPWLEMHNETCTTKTYRQGEEVGSWQVDKSNCQGW